MFDFLYHMIIREGCFGHFVTHTFILISVINALDLKVKVAPLKIIGNSPPKTFTVFHELN